jgi:hypothetical protein
MPLLTFLRPNRKRDDFMNVDCVKRSSSVVCALILAACGGGGGGSGGGTPVTPPSPNPNINATTSYLYQNTRAPTDVGTLLSTTGLSGYYFDARQYVDLDGDGIKEIIVAPGQDITTASPVHIYKQQSGGNYADATSTFFGSSIPGQIHPRKVIVADFNGDGRPDLYFVDHGYDHSPFPGAQNVLMLSNKSTNLWEQKVVPNSPTAFQHCAAAGDINNNNTIDMVVCAEAWQGTAKSPYFLINDGLGNMTLSRTGIPASLSAAGTGMLAVELVDVDKDGYLDLIASYRTASGGAQVFLTTIYWGDGSGSFSDGSSTTLPNPSTFVATYDIKAEDIDGNGSRDLVLLRVRSDLTGYYIQTLRRTAARTFVDESLTRIIKNETTWEGLTGSWFPWIHMTDLNSDASLDIAIGDSSAQIPSRNLRWSNDSSGNFTKLP